MIQSPVEVFSPDDIETAYSKLRDGSLHGRAVIDFARS
jgi:propanol-preferring alcohol dehydrogenase